MEATPLNTDSQSALAMAKNPVHHQRTKQVDVRCHFVRESICRDEVCLKYKRSEQMIADVLIKGLVRAKHEWSMYGMGLREDEVVKEEC